MSGSEACSRHNISEDALIEMILSDIRMQAAITKQDENAMNDKLLRLLQSKWGSQEKTAKKELDEVQDRLEKLRILITKALESNIAGNISDTLLKTIMSGYEKEQRDLEYKAACLICKIGGKDKFASNINI